MIKSCKSLRGSMCFLRPITALDTDSLLSMRNSFSVRCNFPNNRPIVESIHKEWISKTLNSISRAQWLIIASNDSTTIGSIWLENIDNENSHAEFGFYLSSSTFKYSGISVESEYLVLDFAFSVLGLNKIYCETLSINAQVSKMHKRMGFSTDGIFREHILRNSDKYSLIHQSLLSSEFYNITRPTILPILERLASQ